MPYTPIKLKYKHRVRKPTQQGYKHPADNGDSFGNKKRHKSPKNKQTMPTGPAQVVKGLTRTGKVRCMTRAEWERIHG